MQSADINLDVSSNQIKETLIPSNEPQAYCYIYKQEQLIK